MLATECADRYATVVNPIRDRKLWISNDLGWLDKQYQPIATRGLAATWLVQYDVLDDKDLMEAVLNFDDNQELGLFVEMSEKLAKEAEVFYTVNRPWYSPEVVFLSGYQRDERIKLIDKAFNIFKEKVGKYPKSVGAWWIDSFSIGYMREKYGVESVMIVADQKTTDDYGVWGQWWGVPYWPARYNVLKPAASLDEKEEVVVIQWALRDPNLAYEGEGPAYSNYSLQANDYSERGLDTEYFKKLASVYWDCRNKIGQITVGLEVGMEGARYFEEFDKQMEYLAENKNIKVVGMSDFGRDYRKIFPELSETAQIDAWKMNLVERKNENLRERIEYKKVAFLDYFTEDGSSFLDRKLPLDNNETTYFPYWVMGCLFFGLVALKIRSYRWWFSGTVLLLAGWGWLLKSKIALGWLVKYGPVPEVGLAWWQLGMVILVMGGTYLIRKKKNLLGWLPLGFAILPVIGLLRGSIIEGEYWLGILVRFNNFVGIGLSREKIIRLIATDLQSFQAESLLKINLVEVGWLGGIVIPMIFAGWAVLMTRLESRSKNKRFLKRLKVVLAFLLLWHLIQTVLGVPIEGIAL